MSRRQFGNDAGVSIHIPADNAASPPERPKLSFYLAMKSTPLAKQLDDFRASWLIRYLVDRWDVLHSSLASWRADMAKWERMSESDYSDRITKPDPNRGDHEAPDVFSRQNDTLGLSEGFVDFFTAQARNDIFGTRPFLAATPEGNADIQLAELITRHANWKINASNFEAAARDGIRTAAWGGTAFLKSRWIREVETIVKPVTAAFQKSTGEFLLDATGELITEETAIPEDIDGDDIEWREKEIEETTIIYNNSSTACVDYQDIAFEAKAPELSLLYTDVFVRFRMGLLDAINLYEIPKEEAEHLRSAAGGHDPTARDHRDESGSTDKTPLYDDVAANPLVTLIEGYVRVDVLGNGRPVRMHVVFSEDLSVIFSLDYLANTTPGGLLPIFPLRIHKVPNRIFGIGYFEKYEHLNDSVDRKHNIVAIRAREASQVITTIQKDALRDPKKKSVDFSKPIELAQDKKPDDFIQFTVVPEIGGGLLTLRDQELQMAQMRSGITSAAQGELKGVPSANTATGTENIISRGAVLLKDPIDQLSGDVRLSAEFNVHLIYANQDRDETFTWGEGQNQELLTIKANDVAGLRMNVSLTMVQSQNQRKLEQAQGAMQIVTSYLQVPETEKNAVRPLYIQALISLGFRNAEEIIRQAVVDPMQILALLPPEVAPFVEQALQQAGYGIPAPEEGAAPVSENPAG